MIFDLYLALESTCGKETSNALQSLEPFKAPDDLERSPVLTAGKAYFGLLTYGGH